MIYVVLPIIVLVVEILLLGYYIYSAVKTQKFISKGTIIYFVPLSIVLFVLYTLGANYNALKTGISLTIVDYMAICKSVISATVFELKTDYVSLLMENNVIFKLAFSLAVALSVSCVYTSVISLVINTITNKIRLMIALSQNVDVVVGENKYNYEYIAKSKNVIVLTDNYKSEIINEYYSRKIPVIQTRFTKDNLLKQFKHQLKKGIEINFISFQDSDTNLGYIKEFEEFLYAKINNQRVLDKRLCYLKVEIDFNNQITIKNKILENKDIAAFIDCFNRYELFALDFVEKNPITEHLPASFINDELGVINSNKTINVIYLGFGKVCKTLHRVQLMNDQLPTIKNNKIGKYKINYYAFDKDEQDDNADKNMSYFFRRYDENIASYSTEEYLPSLEKLDNLVLEKVNIESYKLINHIENILKQGNKEDVYNRFIISYGEDIDNIDMALKITAILQEHNYENYEVYVRVKGKFPAAIKLLENKKVNIIGDIPSVFNHDVIINERLLELAKLLNRKYNSKRLSDSSWYSLSTIKQSSNTYSSLNVRLKLNLIGYDYIREDKEVSNEEIINEIQEKLLFKKESYDDYLFFKKNKNKPVHSLAYQEHLRWNAFYIGNGYVPLKKTEIELLEAEGTYGPSFYKDDSVLKLHACLTTFEGLDEYHKLLANLLSKANKKSLEENLNTVETYKYDHMLIEDFKTIFTNSNYRLVRRVGNHEK